MLKFRRMPESQSPADDALSDDALSEGRLHGDRLFEPRHDGPLAGVRVLAIAAVAACVAVGLAVAAPRLSQARAAVAQLARRTGGEMDAVAFARLTGGMDPSMLSLADRFAPQAMTPAFARLDRAAGVMNVLDGGAPEPAVLRLQDMDEAQARAWNAANPTTTLPNPAARPFVIHGTPLHQARAADCLAAAVYYEARYESLDGQRAVAQVVLTRVRPPAYPNSVCGVVFQGSNRSTGCQFTFTCDGALARLPDPEGWRRARQVAEAALSGYVMKGVGNATHYHANYVAPYWSPNLLKVATVGAHIFYRWMGGWGLPGAFGHAYGGDESIGFQIAALNRISAPAKIELVATAEEMEAIAPTLIGEAGKGQTDRTRAHSAEVEVVEVAAVESELVAQPQTVAKEAESLVPAEELDWLGRVKSKAPPRVAMPSAGRMF